VNILLEGCYGSSSVLLTAGQNPFVRKYSTTNCNEITILIWIYWDRKSNGDVWVCEVW
jgi:hypothetical protein